MQPGIYIVMDLVLSLMPIHLIRTLNRSTSEKILICTLMALGLLVTAIACAKMTTFTSFGKGDPMQAMIKPSLWAKLEEEVGLIAVSAPALKSHVEHLLKRMGIYKAQRTVRPSFVDDLSMPGMGADSTDTSSSGKAELRFDSVAVRVGNSSSHTSLQQLTGHAV
jgi:hypothetical protein